MNYHQNDGQQFSFITPLFSDTCRHTKNKNLFQVIEPVVLLARTSGFLPVTYEKQGCKYLFQRSLKYVLYSYTLALVLMLTSMIGLCDDLDADRSIRMQNPNIKYIIFFDLGEIITTVFVGIVTAPFKLKYFWKILNGLGRMDLILAPHYSTVDERRRCLITIASTLTVISSILIYDVILWSLNTSQLSVFFQRFTTLYITYFLVFVQQIPFFFRQTDQEQNTSYDRLNDFMKLVEETDDVVEAVNDFCSVHTLMILLSWWSFLIFSFWEATNRGYFPFIILLIGSWAVWGYVNDMQIASFRALGFRGTIDVAISAIDVSEIILSAMFFVITSLFKYNHIWIILDNFNKIDSVFLPTLYVLDLLMWGNDSWTGVNNYFAFYVLCFIVIVHELQYWYIKKSLSKVSHTRISNIVRSYDCLSESINQINKCFSGSVAVIVFSCYLHLVTCPYDLFVILSSNESNALNFVYLLWVTLHVCRPFVIIEVCNKYQQENENTKSLVFQLSVCKLDESVKKRGIPRWQLKLTKRKTIFSAFAISKISRNLIISIANSICNYWMVVLQFSARTIHF
ncbi:hypothetical protein MTP99_006364 [Tenebrio molitor]|nr:hypothetical protein MTP99_006364 [Tenebrio molitor]